MNPAPLLEYLENSRYPSHAGWREPTTSLDAAIRVEESGICEHLRKIIPPYLGDGKTAKDLASELGYDKDIIKPRLTELKLAGRIKWARDAFGKYLKKDYQHLWVVA